MPGGAPRTLGAVPVSQPVVGFDLDMTLVDSAAGIAATLQAALAEVGVEVTPDQVWPTIGVPLEQALAGLAPEVDARAVTARYRQLYPTLGLAPVTLLPGAAAAIEAVHACGGRVLVVSTKVEAAVRDVLARVGLDAAAGAPERTPDLVVGGLFAAAKGVRLRAEGAHVYVGDHPGDIEAARVAGAAAVAVATGPHGVEDLRQCGPEVVLADLTAFPAWLRDFVAAGVEKQVR